MKNNRMHGGFVRIVQASHKCKIMEEQCRLYLTEHSQTTDETGAVLPIETDLERTMAGSVGILAGYIDTNHAAFPISIKVYASRKNARMLF